ncbi:MAG: hypothetical protein Q8M07_17510, partial [Prosthecobacter sp.]|nr:hypothetical protein [Prosthecobacter sp.]
MSKTANTAEIGTPQRLASKCLSLRRSYLCGGKISALAACVLSSCTVGPKFLQPQPKMPADYASKSSNSTAVSSTWWRRLNDSMLNNLIAQSTEQNKDLAVAKSRLLEARALWREAQFDFAPTVTASGTYDTTLLGNSMN